MMRASFAKQVGFTLVEMIIVMVITGIIAAVVAVFIRAPVQGYVDSARRAELTDIADTAIRRISRDVRIAVPNSVIATSTSVEFIPTKDGGRYRADVGGNGNILAFGSSGNTQFDIVGSRTSAIANTDYVVIGSTQSSGAPPYDEASTGVLRKITGLSNGDTTIQFASPAMPEFAELSSQRFDVVDGSQRAVFYKCETVGTGASGNGTGSLVRYWDYGFAHTTGTTKATLADKVSACSFDYEAVNQRYSLLSIRLTLTSGGESVTLYNETHVNNSP